MSTPDPYKVLQVDPEAEEEVIEAAYRRLARKYHPDVAPAPDAQERMVRINQAWEQLRDPVRRAAVDRARARAASQAARVTAADAQARTAGTGPYGAGPGPAGPFQRRTGSTPSGGPGSSDPRWPMAGMRDPSDESRAAEAGSATSRFAPGEAAAGPPPGNPSGSVLNFGRYSGWSLGEIARVELEYLEWLDRMPIGRFYQPEIDAILRKAGRRVSPPTGKSPRKGLFRRG